MNEPISQTEPSWPFPRWWAAFVIALVAVTWKLWFAWSATAYPTVALFGPETSVPSFVGIAASVVLVGSLIGIVVSPRKLRSLWWLVLTALVISFVTDQHRLQPWAYQTAIYAIVFATLERRFAYRFLVLIASSVYIYSALGKIDYQFLHTVGQDFLGVLATPLGGFPDDWELAARAKIAILFPVTELLLGFALLFPFTRRIAAVGVMGMHIALLVILGPWGLNHSTGVLAWNLCLLVQAYLLFFQHPNISLSSPAAEPHKGLLWLNATLTACVMLAPLLERSSYWDHWLSWSLYSPHTSRLELAVHGSAIGQLGPEIQPHVEPDTDGDRWHRLALDRWSLTDRGVPLYPQARYQLGLAVKMASRDGLSDDIRGRLRSVSNRWTGKRTEQPLLGLKELRDQANSYWLWWR
ncbi:MAG: hypothetical protein GY904_01115 [Planctomycetaceae bacterium]|nr:hypothetical protein [Planctomycetaceae bacterium]